jgi:4'-phosphopantetheinyl transferase EntD
MITPIREDASSTLLAGLPVGLVAARVPLADPEAYRALLADDEWRAALAFDGKRRNEHVAGRAAARAALRALVGDAAFAIARGDDGAPRVVGLVDPPLVSISHGRRAAVAVVGRTRALGIDLCDRDDAARVARVARRFVPEHAIVARDDDWPRLWALKEAGAKALRVGLLEGGLRATTLASIDPPRFAEPLQAHVIDEPDGVIAIVHA